MYVHVRTYTHRNASLWTPLDCAAASGHHQLVQLLINSDVDIDTTDKFKVYMYMYMFVKSIMADNNYYWGEPE